MDKNYKLELKNLYDSNKKELHELLSIITSINSIEDSLQNKIELQKRYLNNMKIILSQTLEYYNTINKNCSEQLKNKNV